MILSMLMLLLFQVTEGQPDAGLIMSKSRDKSITGSMSANIKLIITEKNGTTRTRTISMITKSYPNGSEKRFIKFIEPADVKGTAMLVFDNRNEQDEMWIYLPALKKTRRIVSSESGKSFMSSEFSNADMTSPTLTDFVNSLLPASGNDKEWIIESIPVTEEKADEYGYLKKISYISKADYQVNKMEFYNFDGLLFKTILINSVYPLPDGKFIIKNMIADNHLNGRKSEIMLSNITEGQKLDDSYFTLQNLQK